MPTRQFTGKNVDEATDLALETLDLNREEVEIVVVNPGRSGILGFGGEPAVIQVTPLSEPPAPEEDAGADAQPEAEPQATGARPPGRRGRGRGRRPRRTAGSQPRQREGQREPVRDRAEPDAPTGERPAPEEAAAGSREGPERHVEDAERIEEEERQPGPDPEVEELATEILNYLLGSMGVVANTYIAEDSTDGAVAFEIEGEDAGLLIGRRGETLQSIQFLVNMLVNRQIGRPAYVTIDVEGYRERRHEELRTVARRAASRVASSGEAYTLQPMSAADRRIVHIELADHAVVQTRSKGEGGERRVVVLPRE